MSFGGLIRSEQQRFLASGGTPSDETPGRIPRGELRGIFIISAIPFLPGLLIFLLASGQSIGGMIVGAVFMAFGMGLGALMIRYVLADEEGRKRIVQTWEPRFRPFRKPRKGGYPEA